VRKTKEKRVKVLLGVIFLALVAGLVVAGFLWQGAKDSLWDGRSSMGVVYQVDSQISLVVVLPDYQRRIEFVIPGNTMVKVGFGFGEYQLKNVYELGRLEGQGGKVLSRTVQDLMGVAVRGWLVDEVTNLTWWDRIRLWWYEQMVMKKSTVVELRQQAAFRQEVLGDGVEVFRVSQKLLDELVNKLVFNEKLAKEGLSLAVLNAAGIEGVARDVARLLANLGGEVRLVSNLDNQEKSQILVAGKDILESYTVKQLARILGIKEVGLGDVGEYRSEVVVVIGQGYTQLELE